MLFAAHSAATINTLLSTVSWQIKQYLGTHCQLLTISQIPVSTGIRRQFLDIQFWDPVRINGYQLILHHPSAATLRKQATRLTFSYQCLTYLARHSP